MVFQAKLNDDSRLKVILDTVAKVSPKALFSISKNGLKLKAVDDYFSAMVDITLKEDFFAEYSFSATQDDYEVKAMINLDDLKKILNVAQSNDVIHLSYNEDAAQLLVSLVPVSGSSTKKEFILASMVVSEHDEDEVGISRDPYQMDIFSLGLDSRVIFTPGSLKEIIPQVSLFAEEVKITLVQQGDVKQVTFESESEQGNKTHIEINIGPDEQISDLEMEHEKLRSMFKVSHLNNLIKIDRISHKTRLELDEGKPCLFIFEISDNDKVAGEDSDTSICSGGVMIAPVATDEEYGDLEED